MEKSIKSPTKRKHKPDKIIEIKKAKIKKLKTSLTSEIPTEPNIKFEGKLTENVEKLALTEKQIKSSNKNKLKSNTKIEKKDAKIKKIKPPLASEIPTEAANKLKEKASQDVTKHTVTEEIAKKYPILQNEELISKFRKVPLTNNQKGRIRQAIQLKYQGTSPEMLPNLIHSHIQGMLKSSDNLTDSELRRIRILHNMLKTALVNGTIGDGVKEKKPRKKKNKAGEKGPKRYVAFLGNLPLDVNQEKIRNHFVELNEHIVNIRIPPIKEGKKSAFAYLELANEPSYELALSKHHSMLGTRRINVLYSIQKNSKISKAEAKSKSAKLIALQKSGKLIGSVPLAKKRSQRRLKMKKAKPKQND